MLILLPPSEGKTAPSRGDVFEPGQLRFPELSDHRENALAALETVSARPDALELLGVGPSLVDEVKRNSRLRHELSAPASEVYSGVLYDALSFGTLTTPQKTRARNGILVISALWGAIGFDDDIPAYRLSMSAKLPGVGALASYWKSRLDPVLEKHSQGELIIDCRSSTYAAAWVPPAERTVTVNVFQMRNGKRTVVSHFAKHTRGELVRHVLQRRGKAPVTPRQLATIAGQRWETELVPAEGRKPHRLNLVLPD